MKTSTRHQLRDAAAATAPLEGGLAEEVETPEAPVLDAAVGVPADFASWLLPAPPGPALVAVGWAVVEVGNVPTLVSVLLPDVSFELPVVVSVGGAVVDEEAA